MAEERKVALVTGITGQDGSYLTELLLEKGYTVSFHSETERIGFLPFLEIVCSLPPKIGMIVGARVGSYR